MITNGLFKLVRAWFIILRTDAQQVSTAGQLIRAMLLVPPFGGLLIWLRLRAIMLGPWTTICTADFDARFRCRLPDLIQMYIALFGTWEPDLGAYIRDRLQPGDVFVDVGANIGFDSLLAAGEVGEHGSVVAIDASPGNFAELEFNLGLNEATAVRASLYAVSAEAGAIDVYAGPTHNVGLATTVPQRGFRAEARVPCAPLGDLLSNEEVAAIRLIKIDVEGGEPAVMAGLLPMLDRLPDDAEILIELSPDWWSDESLTPAMVLEPFVKAGYVVYEIPNNYWPWRYLWPRCVDRPKRTARDLSERVKRIDVVLSRRDIATL